MSTYELNTVRGRVGIDWVGLSPCRAYTRLAWAAETWQVCCSDRTDAYFWDRTQVSCWDNTHVCTKKCYAINIWHLSYLNGNTSILFQQQASVLSQQRTSLLSQQQSVVGVSWNAIVLRRSRHQQQAVMVCETLVTDVCVCDNARHGNTLNHLRASKAITLSELDMRRIQIDLSMWAWNTNKFLYIHISMYKN